MKLRPARLLLILVIGAIAPLLVAAPSSGAPIDDLRAQAAELTTQLEENGAKVAALGEKLNAAQLRLDESQAKIDDSQARIAASEAHIGELRLQIEAASNRIRAEIVDQGSGFEPLTRGERDMTLTDEGGWGLHLVDSLADDWGVHAGSTHVWFEIRRA